MNNFNNDAIIFLMTHKKLDKLPEADNIIPLQIGAANKERLYELCDNDIIPNISEQNYIFLEMTGIYYIWQSLIQEPEKYENVKYVGQMQYRRWFPKTLFNNDNINKLFNEQHVEFIAAPGNFNITLYDQYKSANIIKYLDQVVDIIKEKYPDYSESVDNMLKSKKLYYSNSFILKKEDYIKYCEFVFDILFTFVNRNGFTSLDKLKKQIEIDIIDKIKTAVSHVINKTYDIIDTDILSQLYSFNPEKPLKNLLVQYQKALCGFLAERIFTIYVMHNFKICGQFEYDVQGTPSEYECSYK